MQESRCRGRVSREARATLCRLGSGPQPEGAITPRGRSSLPPMTEIAVFVDTP